MNPLASNERRRATARKSGYETKRPSGVMGLLLCSPYEASSVAATSKLASRNPGRGRGGPGNGSEYPIRWYGGLTTHFQTAQGS